MYHHVDWSKFAAEDEEEEEAEDAEEEEEEEEGAEDAGEGIHEYDDEDA